MKIKIIITYLLIGFTTMLFSQTESIYATANFTGMHCPGGSGPCSIDREKNISTSNSQLSYDAQNNELIIVISISKIDNTSKSRLLNNELEKNIYLYTFEEDFLLSDEIKKPLDIKNLLKIKKGDYIVRVIDDSIIIKLKLE